jgi:hypothetical protein
MTLPVFDIPPEFVVEMVREPRMHQSDWRQGILHQRVVHPNVMRVWKLVWRMADGAIRDSIRAIYQQARSAGAVLWTPVDEVAQIVVSFASDIMVRSQESASRHAIEFDFEERFNHDG